MIGLPPVGLPCPLGTRRSAVAAEHVPRPPARDLLQVAFLAFGGEPAMRERMAELVRVDMPDSRLVRSASEQLCDPGGRHRTLAAEP